MSEYFDQWGRELAGLVACALGEFRSRGGEEEMVRFAVDCHPWNGVIALAFLTAKEVEESPFLAEAEEIAAWKFYDFTGNSSCSGQELGSRMREVYERERDGRAKIAERFFMACAEAVASKRVQEELARYRLSDGIEIMIRHPDTGVEYYPPVEG